MPGLPKYLSMYFCTHSLYINTFKLIWHAKISSEFLHELLSRNSVTAFVEGECRITIELQDPAGALRYRGGPHLRYVFRGRRGLFLRPPHVRDFVKEGYFFVPRYEVWGSKSPCKPRNIRGSDAE